MIVNYSFSQTNYTDSLIQILLIQHDDTNKVDNLITISRQLSGVDKEKSIAYGDTAVILSKQLDYAIGLSGAFFAKAIVFWKSGNIDSATVFLEQAIKINDSINNYSHLAQNYEVYGLLFIHLNQPENAIKKLNSSLFCFNQADDSTGIVGIYNSFGLLYKSIGEYDSAVYYYVKLLSLSKRIGNENLLSAGLINLGNIYLHLEEYDKAKEYFSENIKYSKRINKVDHLAIAYKCLGTISSKQNNYDDALEYYNLSSELHSQLNDPDGLVSLYLAIGNTYEEQGKYSKAFEYYSKGIKLAEDIGDVDGVIVGLLNKGLIYQKWNNYNRALDIYDSCVAMILKTSDIEKLKSVYYNIYITYELKSDFKNAFIYQTKYNEIKDSVFNLDKANIIADLTLQYEKEKDQARILTLENENLEKDLDLRQRTNQRNVYLFTGSGIIAILFFFFIFQRQKARKDKIIADQKIKQLEEEKKLLAAKFLVEGQEEERKRIAKELHDGLGVLLSTTKMQFTAIKDKSPDNKSIIEKATKLLEQATGDVRKISHNMMPGLLTKFGFYEAAEDLFDKINETEEIKTRVKIIGDTKRLPENKEIMLYRIIQEMVNNTLKHAAAKNISLDINIRSEILNIQYSDDGKGFNVEEKIESRSIGLVSIQSRVNFLNGEMNIDSTPGKGTVYNIQISTS
ncbi:MAG: sensor histidine kinase [Bacteroidales bacterium]|nr:sensor histidine kinase [Bacteroidales bacterium]